ncbi:hypothetical protein ACFW9L_05425 [Streptomyces sp. NPDC059517]|uniref:hypothetical protein n=1 Tax=Streptomyces sp. NPDC059517 TaxID=3346855 RepID=UPI0036AB0912
MEARSEGGRSEGAAPRVPQQARAESRGGDSGGGTRGAGRGAAPRGGTAPAAPVAHAARGEHTHSETPIPQPRIAREGSSGAGGGLPGEAFVPGGGAAGFPRGARDTDARDASTAVPGTEGREAAAGGRPARARARPARGPGGRPGPRGGE